MHCLRLIFNVIQNMSSKNCCVNFCCCKEKNILCHQIEQQSPILWHHIKGAYPRAKPIQFCYGMHQKIKQRLLESSTFFIILQNDNFLQLHSAVNPRDECSLADFQTVMLAQERNISSSRNVLQKCVILYALDMSMLK